MNITKHISLQRIAQSVQATIEIPPSLPQSLPLSTMKTDSVIPPNPKTNPTPFVQQADILSRLSTLKTTTSRFKIDRQSSLVDGSQETIPSDANGSEVINARECPTNVPTFAMLKPPQQLELNNGFQSAMFANH
jgi:hypothetical protein